MSINRSDLAIQLSSKVSSSVSSGAAWAGRTSRQVAAKAVPVAKSAAKTAYTKSAPHVRSGAAAAGAGAVAGWATTRKAAGKHPVAAVLLGGIATAAVTLTAVSAYANRKAVRSYEGVDLTHPDTPWDTENDQDAAAEALTGDKG